MGEVVVCGKCGEDVAEAASVCGSVDGIDGGVDNEE